MNPMNTPRFSDLMGVRFASGNAQVVIHKAVISDPMPFLPPVAPGAATAIASGPAQATRPGGFDYGFLNQGPGLAPFMNSLHNFRFFGGFFQHAP